MNVVVLLGLALAEAAVGTKLEVARTPEDAIAPLWDSARSAKACQDAVVKDFEQVLDATRAGRPRDTKEPTVCTESTLARLTNGTQLATKDRKECAAAPGSPSLVGVRVLSGKHAGKEGCIFTDNVKPAKP